ncbi:uncharacterized protein LOC116005784 [Ipomoea triloba]|uniref:uncharacterized protein LOC116005784 n=1 Tax=Ipomoea triloba TaxID=35885 RepID=UPI00125CFBEF|nr:uncharacterized protein LOC116005784 [Ipomoea triloba]
MTLVNSPEWTFFLEYVDASGESHDAYMLAGLLETKIEQIGEEIVVQVVTENGANYKAVGRLLEERIPSLFWTPCVAHCLDLMLDDIGKLAKFEQKVESSRHITTFIYRHGRILSAMREFTSGTASHSILVALRIVYGNEIPAMPKVAMAMVIAKKKLNETFASQSRLLSRLMDIVEGRWPDKMEVKLYGAALLLNLSHYLDLKENDLDSVCKQRACFNDMLEIRR